MITGRSKDLIIVGGRNIWPQDLEWAVEHLEGVRAGDVAAFAVNRDDDSERVVAVVQCRATTAAPRISCARRWRPWCAGRPGWSARSSWRRPARLTFTTSGKLSRAAVKADYLSGAIRDIAAQPASARAPSSSGSPSRADRGGVRRRRVHGCPRSRSPGATGFVGRHVATALRDAGIRFARLPAATTPLRRHRASWSAVRWRPTRPGERCARAARRWSMSPARSAAGRAAFHAVNARRDGARRRGGGAPSRRLISRFPRWPRGAEPLALRGEQGRWASSWRWRAGGPAARGRGRPAARGLRARAIAPPCRSCGASRAAGCWRPGSRRPLLATLRARSGALDRCSGLRPAAPSGTIMLEPDDGRPGGYGWARPGA